MIEINHRKRHEVLQLCSICNDECILKRKQRFSSITGDTQSVGSKRLA
jgi:hypothetical protein